MLPNDTQRASQTLAKQLEEVLNELMNKKILPPMNDQEKKQFINQIHNELIKNPNIQQYLRLDKPSKAYDAFLELVIKTRAVANADPQLKNINVVELLLTPQKELTPEQKMNLTKLKLAVEKLIKELENSPELQKKLNPGQFEKLIADLRNHYDYHSRNMNTLEPNARLIDSKAFLSLLTLAMKMTPSNKKTLNDDETKALVILYNGVDPRFGTKETTITEASQVDDAFIQVLDVSIGKTQLTSKLHEQGQTVGDDAGELEKVNKNWPPRPTPPGTIKGG